MLSVSDFITLAARDHALCCKVEEDFPDEYAVTAACYHIQQAVEKQLKALILLYGEAPEFTHNIVKLAKKCEDLGIVLPEVLDDISDTLTMWESSMRYDPFIAFSEKKYSKAKIVYDELKTQINDFLNSMDQGEDEFEEDEPEGLQPTM